MSIEAMKIALEALEEYQAKGAPFWSCDAAADALRAAIEQAQPELEQAMTDAIIGGTGVMLGDKRIDPASIYKQPEQEPVAWRTFDGEGGYDYRSYDDNENYAAEWAQRNPRHVDWVEPLYTTPPHREWVGLTNDEKKLFSSWLDEKSDDAVFRAIETKLKEKNT